MPGLLKSFVERSSKASDKKLIQKANKSVPAVVTVKGGKGIAQRIEEIKAVVNTKLGKYADKYVILDTDEKVQEYFKHIKEKGIAAIDTETSSLEPITTTLAGVCLYVEGQKAAYIPVGHMSYITHERVQGQVEPEIITQCLKECDNVKWVFHTAVFDIRVIRNQLNITLKPYWDTMLAACCLNENESHRLKDLHLEYCNSQDKESLTFGSLFDNVVCNYIPVKTFYLYAAGDPIKTMELMRFQQQYLNPEKLPGPYNVFWNLEMPIVSVVADMEDRGICLDLEVSKKLSEKYNTLLQENEKKVYQMIEMYREQINQYRSEHGAKSLDDPINLSSPKQLAILFYDIMGMKSPDSKKPRGTGEEILTQFDTPVVRALLDYRQTFKLISTYIDKLPNDINAKTGRIHPRFKQYGAATGRFSSESPKMRANWASKIRLIQGRAKA